MSMKDSTYGHALEAQPRHGAPRELQRKQRHEVACMHQRGPSDNLPRAVQLFDLRSVVQALQLRPALKPLPSCSPTGKALASDEEVAVAEHGVPVEPAL